MSDRELDVRVAREILKHEVRWDPERGVDWWETRGGYQHALLPYSSDKSAAMTVFEKMVERTGCGGISLDMEDARGQGHVYVVRIGGLDGPEGIGEGPLPLAVCQAALAALSAATERAGKVAP